ncbi:MAG: phosphoribosylamine--glycine ligase, partial [Candidatus Aenigmarchaeota archaeon]|nr:phosphoribosylamine--glycine ligase [Candidatus Aenigmarchaeota archaeon]
PGNGGTATEEKCENVPLKSYDDMAKFAEENHVGLTVVGPEKPLVDGIVDLFDSKGLRIFGPSKYGAQLEGDKVLARSFMQKYDVPGPDFCALPSYKSAVNFIENCWRGPVYVKASGLAAGKGSIDGSTPELAKDAIKRIMLDKEFGSAGDFVVIEEKLEGEEVSYMAFIRPSHGVIVPLLPSQDHKKLLDGDNGPNTGGMGAYAPVSLIDNDLDKEIYARVLVRTASGLNNSDIKYTGALYPGIMVQEGRPFVLEYNVRMGDPETQPVLSLMESDMYEVMMNVIGGEDTKIKWRPGYAVCVVLASKGYPENPEKGRLITGLDKKRDDVYVFHAGTKQEDGKIYTSGGRVLGITAYGKTIGEARDRAYSAIEEENGGIFFGGMFFRKDIGMREVNRR